MSRLPDETVFTEDQVGEILRLATQRAIIARSHQQMDRNGATLGELKALASEIGLQSDDIESAALDVSASVPAIAGRGSKLILVREVGAIDDTHWGEMVHELRNSVGRDGKTERNGSAWEWSDVASNSAPTTLRFSAVTRDGCTRLHLLSEVSGLLSIIRFFAVMYALGGTAMVLLGLVTLRFSWVWAVPAFLVLWASFYQLGTWSCNRWRSKHEAKMRALMARMCEVAQLPHSDPFSGPSA